MIRLRCLSRILISNHRNFSTTKAAYGKFIPIARNIQLCKNDRCTKAADSANRPRLIVLMSWFEAKEKHIDKYREYYFDRGFDVLSVKTSATDILLPGRGPKEIGLNMTRFVADCDYPEVMIHGFSVAGFMLGQALLVLDQQPIDVQERFYKRLQGCIFDSIISVENVAVGVANGMTRNKALAKFYQLLMSVFITAGYSLTTRHFLEGVAKIKSGLVGCPSLFLISKGDTIADPKIAMGLANIWAAKGLDVRQVLFESAPHVQIYTHYPDRYLDEVGMFLNKIGFSQSKRN